MFIVGMLSWWYSAGWKRCLLNVVDSLAGLYDYFSFELLIKTLFSPFRQISAGRVRGSLEVQFRAWLDRLISRLIGAFIRLIIIIVGTLTLVVASVIGLVRIVLWPIVPWLPIVGLAVALTGWVPWKI
ncbi:hypothetical protein FBF31_03560 [Candidatus Saccharibacteria bacterium oral taxon 955]|nr:hypothetical protein FBF33_03550 [Candidatus Saccharibacteria bacterium oral taxon 955]QJU06120.1 hypothetical protein FBF31_03560 [Candidatus Saccharibacteria bacterium oral taxon 955]